MTESNIKLNKILFLGPTGSYSDFAKNMFKDYYAETCEFEYENSIIQIMRNLNSQNADNLGAVIPIENSIEGIVRETQDNLIDLAKNNIRITAETCLGVKHCLISKGVKSEVKYVTSHPQALAQCRDYINKNLNNIEEIPVMSTSQAVKNIVNMDKLYAAIGSEYSAKIYNLPVIDTEINDEKNNTTRFILLSKIIPQKRQNNKVCLVFSTENKAGALNRVLNIFEKYELNMSYIDSRPSRKELGEYIFYVDFEGYIEDPNVNLALVEVQKYTKFLEILSIGANYVEM